jgi:phage FluMu protein Com
MSDLQCLEAIAVPAKRAMRYVQYLDLMIVPAKSFFFLGWAAIDKKYLREYRCPTCHKLLAKGTLIEKGGALEVKCRGCHTVCLFQGGDADIVRERARLMEEGKISSKDPA